MLRLPRRKEVFIMEKRELSEKELREKKLSLANWASPSPMAKPIFVKREK
jgi:hypothetical protein